jgi:(2R)-sulfolactate sulfo-lyase subunit alpha
MTCKTSYSKGCGGNKRPDRPASLGGTMSAPHFLVHNPNDSCGVVVVEDIEAGTQMVGWITDTDETITVVAKDAIPLGHKVAVKDIAKGGTVLKYGHDIGVAISPIAKGCHAHVHNMKTKRW